AVTGGALAGGSGEARVAGVTTDSRADVAGKLFVALSGERFDGHRFVEDVARAGAAAVLVGRDAARARGGRGRPRSARAHRHARR
ncbi:MAG TPA: Mur ligase domain-containing protein, partial [Polyangiaceae bacterium]